MKVTENLRIALVGCGQIADAHLQEIRHVTGATTVAVCDNHLDLAKQAAARFGVPGVFDDLARMLEQARPDVLHITTPPQSHRELAILGMKSCSHVYTEKPFAVDLADAEAILAASEASGRLICIGHDQLFDVIWLEVRRRLEGAVGRVVHIESIQGYDLTGTFGQSLVENRHHWVRRLPGGLFQNVMSHALYRITDLMPDEAPEVWATWFGRERAGGMPSELRVMLRGAEVTANLVFTASARPVQRVTRIFGTRGGLEVDLDAQVIRHFGVTRLPGAFAKVEAPLRQAGEATRATLRNVGRFLKSDIHYFGGMRGLISAFYRAVAEGGPPPIAYREIRRVTGLMDAIFASCRDGEQASSPRLKEEPDASRECLS